jgi:hypothetical protein
MKGRAGRSGDRPAFNGGRGDWIGVMLMGGCYRGTQRQKKKKIPIGMASLTTAGNIFRDPESWYLFGKSYQ